jgi:hypothetical protein
MTTLSPEEEASSMTTLSPEEEASEIRKIVVDCIHDLHRRYSAKEIARALGLNTVDVYRLLEPPQFEAVMLLMRLSRRALHKYLEDPTGP